MSEEIGENTHLPTHVAVCAERYKGINGRLGRLENAAYGIIFIMLSSQFGLFDWIKSVLQN